ncbi:hypothetical protein ALC57_06097 [Trachymyrmex cornetzi]|uniref:Uncharacterized protein n=1 Tax=Trachymyrmex cornetzi TaxID=471704 RepID=A0A195E9I6_9HYME|nr:hypothetical protein ALC57_06097 [Trachymyrmex cornetzi]
MVYKGVDRITPRDGTGDNERLNRRYKLVIKRPTSRQHTPSIGCPIDVMCCLPRKSEESAGQTAIDGIPRGDGEWTWDE